MVLRLLAVLAVLAIAGCETTQRIPFTPEEQAIAVVAGIPDARLSPDDRPAILRLQAKAAALAQAAGAPDGATILSLSGGGVNGAFGAGFLAGWSETGTRPEFAVVTGVSAGALIAPFAFLGPAYDARLRDMFTAGIAQQAAQFQGVATILAIGRRTGRPLRELVARYVDRPMLDAVAAAHRKGRLLLVVTTNLDAQRTVIWNMGEIASSNHPGALDLFRDVLVASASIPAAFPPVFIPVEANGRRFSEMHVDGAVTTNVLIVPETFLYSATARRRVRPRLFIVINNKLTPDFEVVRNRTIPIVTRSVSTILKASTRSILVSSQNYAQRQGWDFNLAYIDPQFNDSGGVRLDAAYLQRLYDHGLANGRANAWAKALPPVRAERRLVSN